MLVKSGILAVAAATVLCLVTAHPGENLDRREMLRQAAFNHHVAHTNKRALDACSQRKDVLARKERAMERRFETFKKLREQRGLSHCMSGRRGGTKY